jgi:hypothetical protein
LHDCEYNTVQNGCILDMPEAVSMISRRHPYLLIALAVALLACAGTVIGQPIVRAHPLLDHGLAPDQAEQ